MALMKVKNYEIQQKRMKLLFNIIYYLEILLTLVKFIKFLVIPLIFT